MIITTLMVVAAVSGFGYVGVVPAKNDGPLSPGDTVAGMNRVKPRIAECYEHFDVPGIVIVKFVIDKAGTVTSATVAGKFAGTPTGACAENAARTVTFPSSGEGRSLTYPFIIRSESDEPPSLTGSLDSLLADATSASKRPPRPPEPPAHTRNDGPLPHSDFVAGMVRLKPRLAECYGQVTVPATVVVDFVIDKTGNVTSATANGWVAGTLTGACVEKAAKAAKFPPSAQGLSTEYPFVFRPRS